MKFSRLYCTSIAVSKNIMAKILPEFLINEDDDDSDDEANYKRKFGKNKASIIGAGTSKYALRRKELKERVINEVLQTVLPDMGAFNMDDIIHGKREKKRHWIVTLLMTLGFLDISAQECILTGAKEKLIKNITKNLMSKTPDDDYVNQRDEYGRPLLCLSIFVRRGDIAMVLLGYDALPDLADEERQMTPLMYSVISSMYQISERLIEAGADVNLSDINGVTPLMMACHFADFEHSKLLLESQAIVDSVDNNGWTALHYCAYSNAANIAMMLIDEGADRRITDLHHRKAIHIARHKDFGDVIAILEDYTSKLA